MYAIFGRHSFSRAPPTNHFWANQSLALSTKAPYPYPPSDHISGTEMPVCYELLQIQQLTRHGARYPNLNEMQRINRVYELLRPVVPPTWIIDDLVDTSKAGLLSRAGEQEIASIAERTMLRYRRIFDKAILNPESVRFVSSDKQRTRVSAQTFRNVLSEDNPRLPQTTVIPQENDTMLSMYHICPAWIRDSQQLKQHDAALETLKFDILYGSQILWMIDFRLGGLRTPLLMGDADVIYRLCGYDLSLYQNDGRWCTLLDQTMSEYFELRRDIEYSRVYGPYGAEVNKRMACVLFTDILADIDSAMANPDSATSTFRFGHAETMSFVSTLLQLEDTLGKVNTPITGNMSLSDALDRGFRTTVLAPFSTNLVIELYRLGRSTGYVRFLLNERVIRLSKCSHDICPLYVLRQMLAAHIGCNFKEICQLD
ncbi:hypothetical protein LPJ59_000238 [Coemansia sp. RSA 2399]|nr:hypothetical protein LPJ59_000238 [Coemansia sp. RSA 2399]KAJ1908159.1 hypothetical protein LPJ81_000290 [Coemansia sp. IMI 209127]